MNLWWVAAAAVLPLLVALLVAWPFWRKHVGDEMGTVVGAFVVFTCVILFVGREYVEIKKIETACIEREIGLPILSQALYPVHDLRRPCDDSRHGAFRGRAVSRREASATRT